MAVLRYLFILLVPVVLSGCSETFYPDIDVKPVLCINSLIRAGSPIEVRLTHSWVFNDEAAEENHEVDDATLYLFVNDKLESFDYIPVEGDNIRIVAESPKYGKAEASVRVPDAVEVSCNDFKTEILDFWQSPDNPLERFLSFNLRVPIKLVDRPVSDDYYRLSYHWKFPDFDTYSDSNLPSEVTYFYFSTGTLDYKSEPLFFENVGAFESIFGYDDEGILFFTDKQFADKSYTLNIHIDDISYYLLNPEFENKFDFKIVFQVAAVSRSYYDEAICMWQRDSGALGELGDIGFAEPIWGYSNVSTGAGVVAAETISTLTIDIKDFLEKAINQQ